MKSLLSIISNKETTNTALATKLNRVISVLKQDEILKSNAERTEKQILSYHFPPQIISEAGLKQSDYSNNLEYKKQIVKLFLAESMARLKQKQKQERENLECINHIYTFFETEQIKNSESNVKTNLHYLQIMEQQYSILEGILKNPKIMDQIKHRLNLSRSQTTNQLKALARRELKTLITVRIALIKECVPYVKEIEVFKHWMFTVFEDLLQFNGVDKTLKLCKICLPQGKQTDQSFYRLNLELVSINFRKDDKEAIDNFIQMLQNTCQTVRSIQKQIKQCLQSSVDQKAQYKNIRIKAKAQLLEEINLAQQEYLRKAGQQIFPSIYLFSFEHRQKLFKIFNIEVASQTNTMASLLLSYKYSIYSKYIEAVFENIALKIAKRLMEGDKRDEQFEQVCFFLEVNTKIVNKKDGKKNIKGTDFALSLVGILIKECIDSIEYEKVERLLRIQNSLREFKNSITY